MSLILDSNLPPSFLHLPRVGIIGLNHQNRPGQGFLREKNYERDISCFEIIILPKSMTRVLPFQS
jgi:hypothetical protein